MALFEKFKFMTSLSHLPIGQKAKIICFETNEKTQIRFMEMGLCINDLIQVLGKLPLGGNLVILSEHGKFTLRKKEAHSIKTV